ncbi:uncharacterized protein BDW43DRAFT_305984 [Aspergillus alliaceus]|uniref:uncharacterized protein n=1 Tax=Petromyces alliaceus TaxID=209559 RepID=UPI0012A4CBC5|nr:uncharacterized protein BDW43DRAFT_305984 [Aspergillus alliaceus]KAB8239101.1 hypothetical protein BDW43DRAFT_305984 [Aspergillus alliaceus]
MYAGDDHNDHGLPAWSEVRWNLLARPFKEERFTRVWFILEVALSQVDPVIIRGRQQYGWDRFAWDPKCRFDLHIHKVPYLPADDKIYGLTGLAAEARDPQSIPPELRVDYSLTVAQVYKSQPHFYSENQRHFPCVTRANGVEGDIDRARWMRNFKGLPSWVPNEGDSNNIGRESCHSNITSPVRLGFTENFDVAGWVSPVVAKQTDASVL